MSNGPSDVYSERSASDAAGRATAPSDAVSSSGEQRSPQAVDAPVVQEKVAEWVRDNPMLALLGGIALGVFIGTWMRS